MKKIVIFLILLLSTVGFSQSTAQKIKLIDKLIFQLKNEMRLLKNGQKNVNGYAIYGLDCPREFLTGDDLKDQFLSSKSRIRIIEKEIRELEILKNYLKTGRITPNGTKKEFKATLLGISSSDFGGRYEYLKPDGSRDYLLQLTVNFPGKYIKNIEIRNTNGQFTVWDTIPGNGMWNLFVCNQYNYLFSNQNGGLKQPIPAKGTYFIYLPDNGSIREGKTNYKLTVFFTDGTKAETKVVKNFRPISDLKAVLVKRSNRDFGGRYEEIKPDGEKDYLLELTISYRGKTIKDIEIRNINGQFTVWDTIPRNGMWALAVVKNGQLYSYNDSSIRPITLNNNREKILIYLPDNGSIRKGNTDYKLTVFFTDGSSAHCRVKKLF